MKKKKEKKVLKKLKKNFPCPSPQELKIEYIKYLEAHPEDRQITFSEWIYYRTKYWM